MDIPLLVISLLLSAVIGFLVWWFVGKEMNYRKKELARIEEKEKQLWIKTRNKKTLLIFSLVLYLVIPCLIVFILFVFIKR